jgi:hypothetical protein
MKKKKAEGHKDDEHDPDEVWSPRQLGKWFDVCGPTVRRWESLGLPTMKLGDRIRRYRRSDVLAWARQQCVATEPTTERTEIVEPTSVKTRRSRTTESTGSTAAKSKEPASALAAV